MLVSSKDGPQPFGAHLHVLPCARAATLFILEKSLPKYVGLHQYYLSLSTSVTTLNRG